MDLPTGAFFSHTRLTHPADNWDNCSYSVIQCCSGRHFGSKLSSQ